MHLHCGILAMQKIDAVRMLGVRQVHHPLLLLITQSNRTKGESLTKAMFFTSLYSVQHGLREIYPKAKNTSS